MFILGAGASVGAVPGTAEMVNYFEKSLASDPEDLADFKSTVRTLDGAQQYQAAARFLIERAGLTHLNRVIRLATLRARTPTVSAELARNYLNDESRLKDLEDDFAGWAIPQGIAAIARVLSRVPIDVRGPILTTNFDPLLETALHACGIESYPIVADGDGSFTYPERPSAIVPVAHLHGYWRLGDTLHTSAQLERPRPRLLASLRQILTNSTCVVLGYGGWDDILTSSILQLVAEGNQRLLEVLWANHGPEPTLGALRGNDLPGRIQPYVNVDINSLMPAVDNALASRSKYRLTSALFRKNRQAISGCTPIDTEFRRFEMARDSSPARTLAFFDGREPNWGDIFGGVAAPLARSRAILGDALLWEIASPGYLIEGPTGEGKSTVLKQVAGALAERSEYQVWWANQGDRVDVDALLALSVTSARICLFVDDADLHVAELAELLERIEADERTDIRVFMAARDTDWRRSASRYPIPNGRYVRHIVNGISLADATMLVEGWSAWGGRGLGRLADISGSSATRAEHLYQQSLGAGESALLGALLSTRYGGEFREHIRELLARLGRVALPGRKTLLDGYLIVCAVHEMGLGSTAIEHLAWALGLTEAETLPLVVNRLGFEAAAQRHGDYLAPRHPRIARVAIELAEEFGRPLDQVLHDFVADVTAHSVGSRWGEETLAVVFAGQRIESEDVAVAAMAGAVAGDPSQLRLRCAQIGVYRRFEKFDLAEKVCSRAWSDFSTLSDTRIAMRSFYREWSRVVGLLGDYRASAALNACALLDLPEADRNDRNNAGRALSGLAFCLQQLGPDTLQQATQFAGTCAEEAMNIATDSETRAQAERTLGRAVYDGYQTAKNDASHRQVVRDSVRISLTLSNTGPARQLRARADEIHDLLFLLGI